MRLLSCIFVCFIFSSLCAQSVPAAISFWTKEPVETVSASRQRICLNGVWKFQPTAANINTPSENWGYIRQPGSWITSPWWASMPGVVQAGKQWPTLDSVNTAWYEREVQIPSGWKGSRVLLKIEKLSTDAVIFIDKKLVAILNWDGGEIDVTNYLLPGKRSTLRLQISAAANEAMVPEFMGTATEQLSFRPAKISSAGITGDVWLYTRPKVAYIDDVFVQTSVRKKQLQLTIGINNLPRSGAYNIQAAITDGQDKLQKTFHSRKQLLAADSQDVHLSFPWPDPLLWEPDRPNQYTLYLSINGMDVQDTYRQPFGFREFWIDGKEFYLNNKKINLRPTSSIPLEGMDEAIDAHLDGLRKAGFNFLELWPNNEAERGYVQHWSRIAERADAKGFLLSGVAQQMNRFITGPGYTYQWDKPCVKEQWKQWMKKSLQRERNHPSIVMWGTSANFFGNAEDQNPHHIGQKDWLKENEFFKRVSAAANEGIRIIKSLDPTRPVFTHHGTYVGDVHTLNFYLNLIPLQEREEWLSHYSQHGTLPFMGIEFGTPLECTFLRGRNGFSRNIKSEPWMTEFSAMYLGTQAYRLETPAYRQEIKNQFIGGDEYRNWQFNEPLNRDPSFQAIQKLFITNTWRSWRTMGIPGGMVPWNDAHGWIMREKGKQVVVTAPFKPGRSGPYYDSLLASRLRLWAEPEWEGLPAGKALKENNNDYLLWIAGRTAAFTEKSHHFAPGDWVEKQVVLINDSRNEVPFQYTCWIEVDGKTVLGKAEKGTLAVASVAKHPIRFLAPGLSVPKADGLVRVDAVIGGVRLQDSFSFRVIVPASPLVNGKLFLYDPIGKTKNALEQQGYQCEEWNGDAVPLLLIGKDVLAKGYTLPGSLKNYVANGGRCLLFQQQPGWYDTVIGFRTSPYLSRYVFPVSNKHAVVAGLDEKDLRNWNGESDLVPAYPAIDSATRRGAYGLPYYGWRWGNRGSVSTGAIEKPHYSGWRPILEAEFDLAYSPLMELEYGKGRITLCQVDLEAQVEKDVVAQKLLHQLLQYIQVAPLQEKEKTVVLLGSDKDAAYLEQWGLKFQRATAINAKAGLHIIGDYPAINEKSLEAYLEKGGKVLCLPTKQAVLPFGIKTGHVQFAGSLQIPDWKEAAGLSPSDTRWRTECEAHILKENGQLTTGSNGLLGRMEIGKGTLIFCQVDPSGLPVAEKTYFRFTRWRQTRLLTQLLANMGASFLADDAIFGFENKQDRQYSFYHPDYRSDFEMGDNPYRYYRW